MLLLCSRPTAGKLSPGDLEAANFQFTPPHHFWKYREHVHICRAFQYCSVVAARDACDVLATKLCFERRTFFQCLVERFFGLEEIFVEPRHFLIEFAELMGEFARAVRFTRENYKFHGNFSVPLQRAEIRPALREGHVAIFISV